MVPYGCTVPYPHYAMTHATRPCIGSVRTVRTPLVPSVGQFANTALMPPNLTWFIIALFGGSGLFPEEVEYLFLVFCFKMSGTEYQARRTELDFNG
jgi:hypothetical protein